jgi:hypothetical protein
MPHGVRTRLEDNRLYSYGVSIWKQDKIAEVIISIIWILGHWSVAPPMFDWLALKKEDISRALFRVAFLLLREYSVVIGKHIINQSR